MIIIAIVSILFIMLFLGFPIFLAIGFSTMPQYFLVGSRAMTIFMQRIYSGITNYSFLAVPMFMFAGNIMGKAGLIKRIIDFSDSIVGRFTGGLAQVNVLSSILFAGISGSALADTAVIGKALIPPMEEQGYEKGFAAAVTAASSIVGPVIPPSIVMVIYGAAFSVSIGGLFAAGLIPGLTIGFSQMIIVYIISKRKNYPTNPKSSLKEIGQKFIKALIPLTMPIIIVGGIFSGIFTATEASVVAVVYGLFIGVFVYKTINYRIIYDSLVESALTSAGILIIIAAAQKFSWVVARYRIPQLILNEILSITDNKIIILLLINLMLIFAGMFIDRNVNLFLLGPILIPMMASLGLSSLHIAMIIIFGLGVGHLTPPVGLLLFSTAYVAKIDVEEILKFVFPFIVGLVIISLIITFWPSFTEFLPSLIF